MMLNLLVKISEISISIRQSEVDRLTDMVEEAKTTINVCLHLLYLRHLFLCHGNRFQRSRFISQHLRQLFLYFISKEVIAIVLLVGIHLQADVFISHEAQVVQPPSHSILIVFGIHQSLELFVFWIELYHRFT